MQMQFKMHFLLCVLNSVVSVPLWFVYYGIPTVDFGSFLNSDVLFGGFFLSH
jgi:hypothetical protein